MSQHYAWELSQKQSLPLEAKVKLTQVRIREWYDAFDGDVYVSFSGGKDSTVLLHIARQIYPDIPAVFCDTGLEYPEIKDFVKVIPNITIVRPKINFRRVIEKYGYPVISKEVSRDVGRTQRDGGINKRGERTWAWKSLHGEFNRQYANKTKWEYLVNAPFNLSDECCGIMKKSPLHEYGKQTGSKPIIATMASESRQRRMNWLKHGCNALDSKDPKSTPMSFWTEQDVLQYLKEYEVPYCPVYGEIVNDKNGKLHTTGCDRTGCMFCMFGVHREKEPNRFQRMKETHPQIYEYCMKPMDEGGLGLAEVLDFISVKH